MLADQQKLSVSNKTTPLLSQAFVFAFAVFDMLLLLSLLFAGDVVMMIKISLRG